MFKKTFLIIFILQLLYQSHLHSKSTSFEEFESKNLSNYFSGIVAFESKDNSQALKFLVYPKLYLMNMIHISKDMLHP